MVASQWRCREQLRLESGHRPRRAGRTQYIIFISTTGDRGSSRRCYSFESWSPSRKAPACQCDINSPTVRLGKPLKSTPVSLLEVDSVAPSMSSSTMLLSLGAAASSSLGEVHGRLTGLMSDVQFGCRNRGSDIRSCDTRTTLCAVGLAAPRVHSFRILPVFTRNEPSRPSGLIQLPSGCCTSSPRAWPARCGSSVKKLESVWAPMRKPLSSPGASGGLSTTVNA